MLPHTWQHGVEISVAQASPAWPPRPPGEPCGCSHMCQGPAVGVFTPVRGCGAPSGAVGHHPAGFAPTVRVQMNGHELECPSSRKTSLAPWRVPHIYSRVSCFCNYRFALASHFFWALWSIVQAKISSIEFGYMVCLGGAFPLLLPGERLHCCDCPVAVVHTESSPFPEST